MTSKSKAKPKRKSAVEESPLSKKNLLKAKKERERYHRKKLASCPWYVESLKKEVHYSTGDSIERLALKIIDLIKDALGAKIEITESFDTAAILYEPDKNDLPEVLYCIEDTFGIRFDCDSAQSRTRTRSYEVIWCLNLFYKAYDPMGMARLVHRALEIKENKTVPVLVDPWTEYLAERMEM